MSNLHSLINESGFGMTQQKVQDPPEDGHLKSSSPQFKLNVLNNEHTHFREIMTDFENASLTVLKIERLENTMKWKAYKTNREIIHEQRLNLDPSYDIREKYLYHGTSAELKDICELGLDDKLSRNGRFGKGIYFSDNPKKCAKYANHRHGDEGLILCARVILGDIKVYAKGKHDRALLREPEKKGNFKGWRFYDSVQGCPKDCTEYVVYRAQNALIEYLITYSKTSIKTPHSKANSCQLSVNEVSDFRQNKPIPSTQLSASNLLEQRNVPSKQSVPISLVSSNVFKESSCLFPDNDSSSDESSDTEEIYENDNDFVDYSTSSDEDEEENEDVQKGSFTDTDDQENDSVSSNVTLNEKSSFKPSGDCAKGSHGEIILAQKRNDFSRLTGEFSEYLVETFLMASDFNVAKAIRMYQTKKIKDARKTNEPSCEFEELESKEEAATGVNIEPAFVQGKTVPEYNSAHWNMMSENDKEEVIKILVDNFLSITSLSEKDEPVARTFLAQARFDLDKAIVIYYESM